ncbi:MAG: hypothetical protein JWL87_128 [Candidatus Adlerbacteria bacterium]|nr:hypothetical protein [Candidatus Adlerbacteria bacterium]
MRITSFGALAAFIFVLSFAVLPGTASARSLSSGMSGSDVTALQNQLIAKGHLAAGNNTGTFGPLTLAAVKKFQCAQGIMCSGTTAAGYGVAGPRTQAALGGAATGGGTATSGAGAAGKFEYSGWIPYWRTELGTADAMAHLDQLSEINPFVYIGQPDGSIKDAADMSQPAWQNLIKAAQAKKVRIIPTLMWSDSEAMYRILSNQTTRIALEDRIVKLVNDSGYDGIDLDFEGKSYETGPFFSTFLKGLYQRMGQKWVSCTIEARTPLDSLYDETRPRPADAGQYGNNYVEINKYCDRVKLMTYDQGTADVVLNKARFAPYIPVSDPGWVGKVIELTKQSIPAKKLVIGVATYGREYEMTKLSEFGYRYDYQWAFNPRYATDLAKQLGITPKRNSAGELSFTYSPSLAEEPDASETTETGTGNMATESATNAGAQAGTGSAPVNIVWWSDSVAIQNQIEQAKNYGLKGVAIFKIDGGEDSNLWSVLK